jgi:hypothetical protein
MFVNITWKLRRKDSGRSLPRSQNATYGALSQRHRANRKPTSSPQQRTEHDSLCHRVNSLRTQPLIFHTNQCTRRRPLSTLATFWRCPESNWPWTEPYMTLSVVSLWRPAWGWSYDKTHRNSSKLVETHLLYDFIQAVAHVGHDTADIGSMALAPRAQPWPP